MVAALAAGVLILMVVVLAIPGYGTAATPIAGKWKGAFSGGPQDISFTVKGSRKRIVSLSSTRFYFNRTGCRITWVRALNETARIGRSGRFRGSSRFRVSGVKRKVKLQFSGRFVSHREARGTVTFRHRSCGKRSARFVAYSQRPSKPEEPPKPCVWIPLPDGSGYICVRSAA